MSSVYALLMGGLGNQLFQYAAALSFAREHLIDDIYCDPSWLIAHQDVGGITPRKYALGEFGAVCRAAMSPTFPLPWDSLDKGDAVADRYVLQGYFQRRSIVTNEVAALLLGQIVDYRLRLLETMSGLMRPGFSVMIHVRRGDYVTNPSAFAHHGVLGFDYYQNAFDVIAPYKPTTVFVATDDVEFVQNSLYHYIPRGPYTVQVIDKNPIETLAVMSLCDSHIIANSSFSWWGARFSGSSLVVYPKQWTRYGSAPEELVYPEWTGV